METSISLGLRPDIGRALHDRPGALGGTRPGRLREPVRGLPETPGPGLLDLLRRCGQGDPLEVPVGISGADPLWINLAAEGGAHCLVMDDPGPARTDLVRTVAFAMALRSRPSLLQMVPIDLESGSLHLLEILPHVVGDTASDAGSARMTLRWLGAEWEARARDGRCWPKMLVVVDSLTLLRQRVPPRLFRVMGDILARGAALGIHVTAGLEEAEAQSLSLSGSPRVVLQRSGEASWVHRRGARLRQRFVAASLGVGELDAIARGRPFDRSRAPRMLPFPRSDAWNRLDRRRS